MKNEWLDRRAVSPWKQNFQKRTVLRFDDAQIVYLKIGENENKRITRTGVRESST